MRLQVVKIIDEGELLRILHKAKKSLLIEPPYRRKYTPLGLAKISAYIKNNGGTTFFRRSVPRNTGTRFDSVFITSLFTYTYKTVVTTVMEANKEFPGCKMVIGGVCATLLMKRMAKDLGEVNCSIFPGYSKELDITPPDYETNWYMKEPWDKFSTVFTSRGCPNRCPYCAVWKLEPDTWLNPEWRKAIDEERPYAMISDNNLSATPEKHINEVINFLSMKKKKVIFDNGFDCKHVTQEMAIELSRLSFVRHGMRIAFDRIEEDGVFQKAVKLLLKNGIPHTQIMAYVLFNFNDTPKQANYRMKECVKLGIRPYPQQYEPLNEADRKKRYIGKHWTKGLARTFRNFWLLAGYYKKMNFTKFARNYRDSRMEKADWDAWYGKK